MLDQIFFETERLLLRTWKKSDEAAYINLNQDKEVMKYFPQPLSEQESIKHIIKIRQHFREYGYGLFALELKEKKEFIGFTGFSHPSFKASFTPCIEIGWRINVANWQKGFGTEAASGCLKYGFQSLGFEQIYSFTSIYNIPSQKLMQKIGMVKIKEFDHPNLDQSHQLCRHLLYNINSTIF